MKVKSRNKKSRQKQPVTNAVPYHYLLPQDLFSVKVVAFMQGMLGGYLTFREPCDLTSDSSITFICLDSASYQEHLSVDGKQGTNDIPLFRETYCRTYLPAHHAMLRLLASIPETKSVLDALGDDKVGQFLFEYLQSHSSLVDEAYLGYEIVLPHLF